MIDLLWKITCNSFLNDPPKMVHRSTVFARELLHATNILLVPGSGFDWPQPDYFRIVMLPEVEELRAAMQRMGTFLDGYKQQ